MLQPAALLAATLMLTGCVPSEVVVSAPPEPSITPIFASDEDALAAATEAYAKYLVAIDESLSSYATESLEDSSEGPAFDAATSRATHYKAAGNQQVGHALISRTEPTDLESVLRSNIDKSQVQIYVCIDLTAVDVIDEDGQSVVMADRPSHVFLLVDLIWHTHEAAFKVADEEVWENEC